MDAMAERELTKTGRIKKARKGLRIHECDVCGKVYTRNEHLKRHQSKHSTAGAVPAATAVPKLSRTKTASSNASSNQRLNTPSVVDVSTVQQGLQVPEDKVHVSPRVSVRSIADTVDFDAFCYDLEEQPTDDLELEYDDALDLSLSLAHHDPTQHGHFHPAASEELPSFDIPDPWPVDLSITSGTTALQPVDSTHLATDYQYVPARKSTQLDVDRNSFTKRLSHHANYLTFAKHRRHPIERPRLQTPISVGNYPAQEDQDRRAESAVRLWLRMSRSLAVACERTKARQLAAAHGACVRFADRESGYALAGVEVLRSLSDLAAVTEVEDDELSGQEASSRQVEEEWYGQYLRGQHGGLQGRGVGGANAGAGSSAHFRSHSSVEGASRRSYPDRLEVPVRTGHGPRQPGLHAIGTKHSASITPKYVGFEVDTLLNDGKINAKLMTLAFNMTIEGQEEMVDIGGKLGERAIKRLVQDTPLSSANGSQAHHQSMLLAELFNVFAASRENETLPSIVDDTFSNSDDLLFRKLFLCEADTDPPAAPASREAKQHRALRHLLTSLHLRPNPASTNNTAPVSGTTSSGAVPAAAAASAAIEPFTAALLALAPLVPRSLLIVAGRSWHLGRKVSFPTWIAAQHDVRQLVADGRWRAEARSRALAVLRLERQRDVLLRYCAWRRWGCLVAVVALWAAAASEEEACHARLRVDALRAKLVGGRGWLAAEMRSILSGLERGPLEL